MSENSLTLFQGERFYAESKIKLTSLTLALVYDESNSRSYLDKTLNVRIHTGPPPSRTKTYTISGVATPAQTIPLSIAIPAGCFYFIKLSIPLQVYLEQLQNNLDT